MYLNADQLPSETLLQGFDVCIVGTGAAGIPLAMRLLGCHLKVLVLSSGVSSDRGKPLPQRQAIYKGTVGSLLQQVDPNHLDRSRLHMHGGTTNHFGFWARPLDEADFKPREGYRKAGWDIPLAELSPYYRDAHHFGNFGPFNYEDMPFWERVLFARCFPTDGLHGAIMHAQYDEALHDFQVQCGDALRAASNITVLFNANLLHIETDEIKHHVTRLTCSTIEDGQAGRCFRVEAGAYVLAMGGLETVRSLKLAGDLGNNPNDHLGRGFMMHPLITQAAKVRFKQPVPSEIRGFFRDQQVRLQPPTSEGGVYKHISVPLVNPELVAQYCVFNAWGVLVPHAKVLDAEQIGNFRLILRFEDAPDEAIVNINWEQIPNENSRIMLHPTLTDPIFHQALIHLDWQLVEEDKRTAIKGLELCQRYLQAQGATDFQMITDLSGGAAQWSFPPDPGALETGDHHMGAIRMSASSHAGIVNTDSRLHLVDNLYIAGCSVFPTGGFANPTLTIVALALRLGDHLKTAWA